MDESVLSAISSIPEQAWESYKTGHIAETVHSMNKTDEAFRLIVIRRPYQMSFIAQEDMAAKYTVIATNKLESAQQVVKWYNQR